MRPTGLRLLATVSPGVRLDDHPGAIWCEDVTDVPSGGERIAQVVQTIKRRDQVVMLAVEFLGARRLEPDPFGESVPAARLLASAIDASW
jgi:hypothetical protein